MQMRLGSKAKTAYYFQIWRNCIISLLILHLSFLQLHIWFQPNNCLSLLLLVTYACQHIPNCITFSTVFHKSINVLMKCILTVLLPKIKCSFSESVTQNTSYASRNGSFTESKWCIANKSPTSYICLYKTPMDGRTEG